MTQRQMCIVISSVAIACVLGFSAGVILTKSGTTGSEPASSAEGVKEQNIPAERRMYTPGTADQEEVSSPSTAPDPNVDRSQRHMTVPSLSRDEFLAVTATKPESPSAWDLRVRDKVNLEEVLAKLRLAALDGDTLDTPEHHAHINRLIDNHRFRVQVITCLDQRGYLYQEAVHYISECQRLDHQRRLEFLKVGDLTSFDRVEASEQQFFEDMLRSTYDYYLKQLEG